MNNGISLRVEMVCLISSKTFGVEMSVFLGYCGFQLVLKQQKTKGKKWWIFLF